MPIRRHLAPGERGDHTSLQVKMDTSLVEEVKVRMKLDGVSWNELLTACFTAYLEESKNQPPVCSDNDEATDKGRILSTIVGVVALISLVDNPIFQIISEFSDYCI